MSSVAAGLLFATVIKLATVLPRRLAAVAIRRAGFRRCRRHALAAAVGHGRSRAMGRVRGLERAGVMDRLDLGGLFLIF